MAINIQRLYSRSDTWLCQKSSIWLYFECLLDIVDKNQLSSKITLIHLKPNNVRALDVLHCTVQGLDFNTGETTMKKTLTMSGPLQISFDYEVNIGGEIIKDFYKEIIPGIKKEDFNEDISRDLIKEKVNEIIRSIGKRNLNLFPDGEHKVHFEINNPEYKFLCVDIDVESK